MRNIKLTIEYDGRRYLGWQRLGDSDKTIQGKIETVLSQMANEKIEITGSGRTDAGTHALGQVANFKTSSPLLPAQMLTFINHQLPQDIVVTKVEDVPERFHARYNCRGKQYSYYVWNQEIPSAFKRSYSYYFPEELDLAAMQAACEKLVGTHDFIGFSSLKKAKKSTVRTLEKVDVQVEGAQLHFTFSGDGFLYNMVRILMGTILAIGSGELPLSVIDEIFSEKIRAAAGKTVPAQGLFLDWVAY